MPIDYKTYPDNWPQLREQALERDNHKCHFCKVDNYAIGYRAENGDFYDWQYISDALENHGHDLFSDVLKHCYDKEGNPTKAIKIILTTMHLDHDIKNNEPENLVMGCQRCHLNYDKDLHRTNSKETNRKKKGLQNLF